MELSWLSIAFGGFALLTLGAALALALARKLVYAAFLLFVVLFGVAALFVLMGAEFLAVAQVIVYVGGILILLIFGVMLTQRDLLSQGIGGWQRVLTGLGLSLGLGLLLGKVFLPIDYAALPGYQATPTPRPNVEQIGIQIVTRYLLPFELISVLLLLALLGAAYLARPAAEAGESPDP
jgi:NADH:ubiquinone oxidoreductase subunit 6 (subunit J)